ncbi:MAG: hypothetical protein JOZ08_09835 [Verrucomicrobia bacterium]|nr:hypothetical protein [Verrucomicrobiota bacterium]
MHVEKLATQRQLTRRCELANQITEGTILDRGELSRTFTMIADAISSRVMGDSGLSREAKEDNLHDLSGWPLALEDVAHRQSRLPRCRGKRHHEGESELAS